MRVPLGAFTVMKNCPGSVRGKYARPIHGSSSMAQTSAAASSTRMKEGALRALRSTPSKMFSMPSKRRLNHALNPLPPAAPCGCTFLIRWAQNSGTTDIATR